MKSRSVEDQLYSAIVNNINEERFRSLFFSQNLQDEAFLKALGQVEIVRSFISTPENILGSDFTKHGEIAEQVEVAIHNAKQYLNQQNPTATFEGVGRTAPEDYLIDGVAVQSKFVNGLNNNLEHVLKHMERYSHFGRDGSYYHIPKDQFELIRRIYEGEAVEGLSDRTIRAIEEKIARIEAESGTSFSEVVRPGISEYAEVQRGRISETLDRHESELEAENRRRQLEIEKEHQASWSEGLKATAIAAAVGGTLSFGMALYGMYRDGKNPFKGEMSLEDWKKVGFSSLKGGLGGAVTGSAVYFLTNNANLAAPFAGAFVTLSKGIASLVHDLHRGNISLSEFQMNALYLGADSAGVALATLAGQILIPIPLLGPIIGSLAGKFVISTLLGSDQALAAEMEIAMQQFLQQLDIEQREKIVSLNQAFDALGDLRKVAFDLTLNETLVESSILLAHAYDVEVSKILKDEVDLERFLFG
ncbi:hypothetical protein GCM10007161_19650 [Ignatzschineria indica]|uniref:Uncharacterized protein n=1 Tax=Ignatzschineria indica TaxID=472583 RepID=A0A2U2AQ26_9GAMM|nr:hypothetical protein [Ignatzschineria indica]PWD85598.1 hypothetical protein DC082_00265 [Ignatzschineria indica]GGZ88136.1 hypothetical protein GCM10007161_19650 [Ignatzschineria indica]